jgi:tetratricopeptide (TPR) repeat protein
VANKSLFAAFVAVLAFCCGAASAQEAQGDEDRILKALEAASKDPRAAFLELDHLKGTFDVSNAPLLKQALLAIAKAYPLEAMDLFIKFEPTLALEDDAAVTVKMAEVFEANGLDLKAMELYELGYRGGANGALVPLVRLLETYGNWDRIFSLEQDISAYGKEKGQRELFGSLGRAYLERGDPREAFPEFLKAGPALENYLNRGIALMELGHPDAADDSFSLALDMALRGNNPEGIRRAILLKTQNLERAKRYKQAASHYGLFVEKFPKDPLAEWVKMRRGIALLETGQVEQASSLFSALAKSKDKRIAVVARALLGFADIALKNLQGIY